MAPVSNPIITSPSRLQSSHGIVNVVCKTLSFTAYSTQFIKTLKTIVQKCAEARPQQFAVFQASPDKSFVPLEQRFTKCIYRWLYYTYKSVRHCNSYGLLLCEQVTTGRTIDSSRLTYLYDINFKKVPDTKYIYDLHENIMYYLSKL